MTSDNLVKCIEYMVHLRNRCAHPTINYKAKDFDSTKDLSEDLKTKMGIENYEDKHIFTHLAILQYFIKIINPPLGLNFKKDLQILLQKQNDKKFLQVLKNHQDEKKHTHRLLKTMGVIDPKNIWKLELWK